jgi:hypothetical protein
MRHGPHHGAQKSTTTGWEDPAIKASNTLSFGTSIGSAAGGMAVLQRPHRAWRAE